MLQNVLQKPLGMVAVLATAVGGPYAAFETELGNSLRRQWMVATSSNSSNAASQRDILPNSNSDPYSLLASNQTANQSNWQTGNVPNYSSGYQSSNMPPSYAAPSVGSNGWENGSYPAQNVVVSKTYGPTTITNLDPNSFANTQSYPANNVGYYPNTASQPSPILESRSGPSSVVPGGTDKLWDYTLGTPTLPQIQQQNGPAVGGGNVNDLREVLRFDIVPGWLPTRFARVTTVTSNVQMDGLRVPLITGTQPKDIAGTLTYYFDAAQSLKRISLQGLTGDPSQLANLMVQFYQLRPEQSLGGQLFTARWNNRVTSVMQVSPAPIMYAGADHSRYIIFLELNQPSNQYGLSDEASEILRTSQATQRW